MSSAGRQSAVDNPQVEQTPDLLANCGLAKQRDDFYYGQSVFGSVGQFASQGGLNYALDALGDGMCPRQVDGRRCVDGVRGWLASLVQNTRLQSWPLFAFATPVSLSFRMSTGKFSLSRELTPAGGSAALSDVSPTVLNVGPRGSPVSLTLPPAARFRLHDSASTTGESRPTRIGFSSATRLAVPSGCRGRVDVADEVGLLGWESDDPFVPIRTEHYEMVVLPSDGSPEAAAACLASTPNQPSIRRLAVGEDVVVEFTPSLDIWLVDPQARPGGVNGYLVKILFSPDGRVVTVSGSRREMNHILARGTLTKAILESFLPA